MGGTKVGELAVTKLSALHRQLNRLGRSRRRLWLGTGASALLVAVLWAAVAVFFADWLLDMTRTQRIVALAASVLALGWAYRRYTRPWLRRRETELEMAMLVQRQAHIDSDLVAALQFERPEARHWGSVQLEQAVIDQVAGIGSTIDFSEGVPRKPFVRRSTVLVATVAAVALGVWLYPEHALTFLTRMAMGSRHYPTRTVIEWVSLDGRRVDHEAWVAEPVKVAYGQAVQLEVDCSGRLPETGSVELALLDGGPATTVTLSPDPARVGHYLGELPRMLDSVACRILLGDARTEEGRLLVTLPPLVDLDLVVTPPKYTVSAAAAATGTTRLRQLSVVEGSRVAVRIASDKLLREASLVIDKEQFAMARRDGDSTPDRDVWMLPPDGTPLALVERTIRYEVLATDVDDLEPQEPPAGTIRIKADQSPNVQASAITRYVLPTATPTIVYSASDDYGIARIEAAPEVVHADGKTEQREPIVVYLLSGEEQASRSREDRCRLDLGPLKLVPGDQLNVRLKVVDYRGSLPGKSSDSDPLAFDVTDQRGILAAMSESDRESAEQLKTMIGQQIEVGEGP
jgi:hypothetical protein